MPKSPRVADFSTHFSGPVASRRLAQLGADVIKIEHPTFGDGNRRFPPFHEGEGIHHLYLNAGTRSLALDPRAADWPRVVAAVARWADVVIVGNRPSNARRLGIDPATLLGVNPRLVYCMITGYGLAGEWAAQPAHGLNMDALAGAVPVEEAAAGPDVPAHYRSAGTTIAGIEAAMGIYAALYRRAQGGGGQVVHVSIWEAALSWMWRDLATFANTGKAWPNYRDLGSRYAVYGTSDGKAILVCPIERRFWERFCDVLDLPAALRGRGDWSGGADMGKHYADEREIIRKAMRRRTRDAWLEVLRAADVPVAPLLDWREAMTSEHAEANGVMARYPYREHDVRVPTTPVSITAAAELGEGEERLAAAHRRKAAETRRAPYLGEHNAELFRELGL